MTRSNWSPARSNGALAAHVWRDIHADPCHSDRRPPIYRLCDAGRARPERVVHFDILRNGDHLGTRPGHCPEVPFTSPTPRTALVAGKALSAGLRGLSEAVIIHLLAALIGVRMNPDPVSVVLVVLILILGAAVFSMFSLIIACLVKTRERFMGIGQVLMMPLFFASNAIYPIALMSDWLKVMVNGNCLTYMVDAIRSFMLTGSASEFGIGLDITILLGTTVVLIVIGGRLYSRAVR